MLNTSERAINNSECRKTATLDLRQKTKTNETTSSTLKTDREATQTPQNIG
jgi:hypothetical protein